MNASSIFNGASSRRPARRGSSFILAVIGIVITVVIAGGIYWFATSGKTESLEAPILSDVIRGEFVANVLDQGEIRSSENIEIRCRVRSSSSINVLEVIEEGTMIINTADNPRDKDLILVRLDSKSFEKELEQQKLAVGNAYTAVIQAEAEYNAALLAKKEYIQGRFREDEIKIENEKFNAEQELKQSQAYYLHSEKLQKKGFITKTQLDGDKIAEERARNSLELAMKQLQVLREITYEKEILLLESDIEAAKVKWNNQLEAHKIEKQQQAEIEQQIANCLVKPPEGASGQVVYAKERSRGGNDWVLEEGASVRERQVMIRLPNPDKMEVKALINEQSITSISRGMSVEIKVDALNNTKEKIYGVVTKVSQYAESEGFFSGNIKKFPVLIQIDNPPEKLKPGMNASVTIETVYEENAIQVPIQCVFGSQDKQYCLVQDGDGWRTEEIESGGNNSQYILVTKGNIKEGEKVVMNPGQHRSLLDLPEDIGESKIQVSDEVRQRVLGSSDESPSEKPPGKPTAPGGDKKKPGGQGGRPSAEQIVNMFMPRIDKNSDGKVDKDELADMDEQTRERTLRSDENKDGEVTREEMIKAMEKAMKSGAFGGGGGGFGGGRR